MKKVLACLVIGAMAAALLTGCQKQSEEEITPAVEEVVVDEIEVSEEAPEVSAEPEEPEEVKVGWQAGVSDLTGEYIGEELAKLRPVSVMMGNTVDAVPQYGISHADLIYEATVEGSITRLMAFYQDYMDIEKIMSIRSCRYYYIDWSQEFDAIYAHYGQEATATNYLDDNNIEDLNGLDPILGGLTYFRDGSRNAPHNAYTYGEGLSDGMNIKGFDHFHNPEYTSHYQFAPEGEPVTLDGGMDAAVVKLGFPVNNPWFTYNEETGLYDRYQYKKAHVDGENGEQLAVKNVLIQENEWSLMHEDGDHGYLNMETVGDGEGYYLTNGKAIPITWTKESMNGATRYFDEAGNEITLNTGKTWVCVVETLENVVIYADEAKFSAPQ